MLLFEKSLLFWFVKCVRGLFDDVNPQLFAEGDDIFVSDPAKGLRVFFKGEVGCAPFLEQLWQDVRRLAPHQVEPGIEFSQALVKVLQAL